VVDELKLDGSSIAASAGRVKTTGLVAMLPALFHRSMLSGIYLKAASNLSRFVGLQHSIRSNELLDGYHFNIQRRD
jgi:hypothetical protein